MVEKKMNADYGFALSVRCRETDKEMDQKQDSHAGLEEGATTN